MFTVSQPNPKDWAPKGWAIDLIFAEPQEVATVPKKPSREAKDERRKRELRGEPPPKRHPGRVECVAVVLRSVPLEVVLGLEKGHRLADKDPLAGPLKPRPISSTLIRKPHWAELILHEKTERLEALQRAEEVVKRTAVDPTEATEARRILRNLQRGIFETKNGRRRGVLGRRRRRPSDEAIGKIYNEHVKGGLITPTLAVFERFRPATYRTASYWVEEMRRRRPGLLLEPPPERRGLRKLRR